MREFEGVLLRKFNVSSQPLLSTQLASCLSQFIGIMASQSWYVPVVLCNMSFAFVHMIYQCMCLLLALKLPNSVV